MRVSQSPIVWVLTLIVCWVNASSAESSAKCDAGKLKESAKYYLCRLKAEADAKRNGTTPSFASCEKKLERKWSQLESHHGDDCTIAGNVEDTREAITADTVALTARLGGLGAPRCGDDEKNGLEQCDGADLGGASCAGLGFTIGGELSCTDGCSFDVGACEAQALTTTGQDLIDSPGDDGDTHLGAPFRLEDNGDGTVTDRNSGLTWEKKSADGGVHHYTTEVTWYEALDFAAALNAAGFAGHSDWRLPSIRELTTIIDFGTSNPAVSEAFSTDCIDGCTTAVCSCTLTAGYWSSTTYVDDRTQAWFVSFGGGFVNVAPKPGRAGFVRAVRGGM